MSTFQTIKEEHKKYMERNNMRECCGTCKFNKRDFSKPQGKGYIEFCCGNDDSDQYGVPTFYDDTCDDWEEKDE